jgi:hypothetical protein
MNSIKAHVKTIALIFSALILLQGCTIYKSVPVNLEEASQLAVRSKIYYKNSNTQKCRNILKEDSAYYCLLKGNPRKKSPIDLAKGNLMPIHSIHVNHVKIEDKVASTAAGLTVGLVAGAAVVYLLGMAFVDALVDGAIESF